MMRPHEATFTSGPYGHGSRVYAKVVETVIARLEKRLAADAGEHAAGIALAAKVDKAWRETYNRSLPSEEKVKQELKRLAPTGIRLFPREAGSDPVGLNPSTAAGVGENHLAALSSGLWQTAGATRKPYVRKKSKRLLAAEAEAAARRPKRRFVLKAAAARGIGGSGSGSSKLGRKKRLRTNDGAAVNAARGGDENGVAGGRRGGFDGTRGSVRAGPGQAAVDGAGGEVTTQGVAAAAAEVANAREASGSSPPVEGGVEGRNGHGGSGGGGGQLGRAVDRAAASQERAGEQQGGQQGTAGGGGGKGPGSGGEPPEEVEDEEEDDDDDFSLEPKRRPPASSTAAARDGGGAAAAAAAAAASAGADALRGEAGTGRKAQDTARETGPASATRRPDLAAPAANEGEATANGNSGSDGAAGRAGDASAVAAATAAADEDDVHNGLAGAAVPDVAVTANFVGDLLKGRHRSKWRLYLEGGVIEGKDQLFVFDECECLLDPPQ